MWTPRRAACAPTFVHCCCGCCFVDVCAHLSVICLWILQQAGSYACAYVYTSCFLSVFLGVLHNSPCLCTLSACVHLCGCDRWGAIGSFCFLDPTHLRALESWPQEGGAGPRVLAGCGVVGSVTGRSDVMLLPLSVECWAGQGRDFSQTASGVMEVFPDEGCHPATDPTKAPIRQAHMASARVGTGLTPGWQYWCPIPPWASWHSLPSGPWGDRCTCGATCEA